MAEVKLKPHLVHVTPTFEVEDRSWHEALKGGAIKVHKASAKVRRQLVNSCPDCKRGLSSRGDVMVCPLVPLSIALKDDEPGHQGCVIACGTDGSM